MCYEFHVYEFPFMKLCFYGNTFTYELPFYGTMFLWKCVYEWQNKFLWQVFKVSYQPSDLREVMFRLKGTYDCKYETVGDIGRSLPLIPLCLRALVRHRAHMNKFDKFFQKIIFMKYFYECVLCYSVFLMNVYILYKHSCTCWAKAHVVCSCYRRQG